MSLLKQETLLKYKQKESSENLEFLTARCSCSETGYDWSLEWTSLKQAPWNGDPLDYRKFIEMIRALQSTREINVRRKTFKLDIP